MEEKSLYQESMEKLKPLMDELSRIHSPFNWEFWTVGEQNVTPIHRLKFTLHQYRLRIGETERLDCELKLKELKIRKLEIELKRYEQVFKQDIATKDEDEVELGKIEIERLNTKLRKYHSEYELQEIEWKNKEAEMRNLYDIILHMFEYITDSLGREITYEDYASEEPIFWFRDILQKCYNSVIATGKVSKGEAGAMRRFVEYAPETIENPFFGKINLNFLQDPVKVERLHYILNTMSVAQCKKLFQDVDVNHLLDLQKAEWELEWEQHRQEYQKIVYDKAVAKGMIEAPEAAENSEDINGKQETTSSG